MAYTWQGDKVEGVLNVDRVEEARAMLQRDDLIPYESVRVRPFPSFSGLAPIWFQPKPQEVIEFTRGLAALIRSGIPIRDGLTIPRGQGGGLGMKEVVQQLRISIENVSRLSEAGANHPPVFTGFHVRLLRLGEATGRMPESLQQLAAMLLRRKAIPFALARAVNQPEAIITWAAPGGCDVVIVKDSVPVEHQSLFWGADLVEDSVLIDRLTEVTSRTLATFNESSPQGPMPDDTPLYVCGSPISRQAILHDDKRGFAITRQICQNLRLPKGEPDPPKDGGPDFPFNDLIVNAVLALRGV